MYILIRMDFSYLYPKECTLIRENIYTITETLILVVQNSYKEKVCYIFILHKHMWFCIVDTVSVLPI